METLFRSAKNVTVMLNTKFQERHANFPIFLFSSDLKLGQPSVKFGKITIH